MRDVDGRGAWGQWQLFWAKEAGCEKELDVFKDHLDCLSREE